MRTLLNPVCFFLAYGAAILAVVLLISQEPHGVQASYARCLAAVDMGFPAYLWKHDLGQDDPEEDDLE